jgi:hypothetical protein
MRRNRLHDLRWDVLMCRIHTWDWLRLGVLRFAVQNLPAGYSATQRASADSNASLCMSSRELLSSRKLAIDPGKLIQDSTLASSKNNSVRTRPACSLALGVPITVRTREVLKPTVASMLHQVPMHVLHSVLDSRLQKQTAMITKLT